MNLAPANVPCSFEVTFDNAALNVAMSVYDNTGGSPSLVAGPLVMPNISGTYTYEAKFTPVGGKTYVIVKAVYTDDTYTVLSPNYSQGSESIVTQTLGGGGASGCSIVGYVNANLNIVGYVNC
jgi:hypothetical protein